MWIWMGQPLLQMSRGNWQSFNKFLRRYWRLLAISTYLSEGWQYLLIICQRVLITVGRGYCVTSRFICRRIPASILTNEKKTSPTGSLKKLPKKAVFSQFRFHLRLMIQSLNILWFACFKVGHKADRNEVHKRFLTFYSKAVHTPPHSLL